MARTKQATPLRREPSSEYASKHDRSARSRAPIATNGIVEKPIGKTNGQVSGDRAPGAESKAEARVTKRDAGIVTLVIDVAGIYASFLTWAYLQEKLTATAYGPPSSPERFKFPVFLLTIQSLFAFAGGKLFSILTTPRGQSVPAMIPNRQILAPLLLVAFTNALAAPFGYAALAHIDYITYILAKSCKLLPVMFLHITVFRKRYPLYKYLVVAAVTCGVAVFTLHSGSRKHAKTHTGQTAWGLLLLGINLLFDGLTNSTQDYIFGTFKGYSGPQMMAANNLLGSLITGGYLLLSPWLVHTPVGEWFGMDVGNGGNGELKAALAFLARHPAVWRDVLGFALCGCVGQVFIFHTLSTFSSVLLVTVTVTRKMFTMILSVVAFGHRLSQMQWLGVALVFGGIGVEAQIARREKLAKEVAKREAAATAKAQ
ncbi:UAA transporter family-domain-containing protein [Achaetomium macrosporum]|uniref:UDP-galactose transporter homolog 1 n=1 Tax=Achaetomium macrosporum TaxID=79813 RepID=A0AAN7CIX8_9PEZI|nr:UAA transporter family-domain-containing protein [Achaetomium macrosporum]